MSKIDSNEIVSKEALENLISNHYTYETFHESSKMNNFTKNYLGRRISKVLKNKNFMNSAMNSYKNYPTSNKIYLNKKITNARNSNYFKLLNIRRSQRNYINKECNLDDLSSILKQSCGITGGIKNKEQFFRSYPSGGALYPCETYVMVLNVKGIKNGLYHYNVLEHSLELLNSNNTKTKLKKISSYTDLMKNACFTIFITSIFPRSTLKYGDRGYRFSLLEAGHLCQNLSLSALSYNIGSCEIGGYFDDEVNDYLNIDGTTEASLNEMMFGYIK